MGKRKMDSDLHRIKLETGTDYHLIRSHPNTVSASRFTATADPLRSAFRSGGFGGHADRKSFFQGRLNAESGNGKVCIKTSAVTV